MYRILLLIVVLIIYGSLYPWDFHSNYTGMNPLAVLFHSWPARLSRNLIRDAILNVLVYIPLGTAAFMALARKYRAAASLCAAVAIGFALSTSMELAQVFVLSRQTSILDVSTNTAGTFVGACFGWSFFPRWSAAMSRRHRAWNTSPGAFTLIAIWLAYQLYPLVPGFGLFRLPGKLVALTRQPVSGLELLAATAGALALGMFVEAVFRRERADLPFACLLLAVPGRLLMLGRQLEPAEVLGAAAGWIVWTFLPGDTPSRYRSGATIVLPILLLRGLAPFRFVSPRAEFTWIPFAVSMGNGWTPSALVLLRKLFDYGSALWLVHLSGARLLWSTGVVALLLAAIEATQMWLPGRAAESTDPLLALMLGFILWRLEKNRRPEDSGGSGRR